MRVAYRSDAPPMGHRCFLWREQIGSARRMVSLSEMDLAPAPPKQPLCHKVIDDPSDDISALAL